MTTDVDNEDTEKWSEVGSLDETEVTDNIAFKIVIRSDLNVQSILKKENFLLYVTNLLSISHFKLA